jgi:hypothetical protein
MDILRENANDSQKSKYRDWKEMSRGTTEEDRH